MHTLVIASQKGGSGKTTLATNLAVAVTAARKKVLLLDLDPQRSTEHWYLTREAEQPAVAIIESRELPDAIKRAKQSKIDWLIIDTPGRDEAGTAAAIRAASFCLVPCRPTPQDMKAIPATVDTINRLGKPFAFVITQAPPRGPRVSEARVGLSMLGQVCPTTIVSRTTYQDASGTGKGVTEYDAASKAAIEIRTLWQWLQRHIKKRHHG